MVIRGELTIGTLYAFYVYLDMLTQPMMDVPFLFMAGQQAFVSIDRVEEIRSYPVVDAPRRRRARWRRSRRSRFDGVVVRVRRTGARCSTASPSACRRASKVAIVGPVASGKSTRAQAHRRDPGPARGRDPRQRAAARRVGLGRLPRRRIGYVPQEGAALLARRSRRTCSSGARRPTATAPTSSGRGAASRSRRWTTTCASCPTGVRDGRRTEGRARLRRAEAARSRSPARWPAGREVLLLDDCTAALDAHNEDRFWSRLDDRVRRAHRVHRLAPARRRSGART